MAVSVCKRLYPDYQTFFQENGWGNPDALIDAIRFIESHGAEKADKHVIETITSNVLGATPDTEDFGEANYALNACCAVCSTLAYLLEGKSEHIYYVGMNLIDTIDARAQEDNDLTEEEIDQHPLMMDTITYLLEATKPQRTTSVFPLRRLRSIFKM